MARRYGWKPRGERLVVSAPIGRWKTALFFADRRSTGIIAPLALDEPITGAALPSCPRQFPAPKLMPHEAASMDNLAAHKTAPLANAA